MAASIPTTKIIPVVLLAALACGPRDDDCTDRLRSGRPIPAEGCCTAEGFCIHAPLYDEACRSFARERCAGAIYPPVYDGGPEWTFCPPVEGAPCTPIPDGTCAPRPTPCPIAWLRP